MEMALLMAAIQAKRVRGPLDKFDHYRKCAKMIVWTKAATALL